MRKALRWLFLLYLTLLARGLCAIRPLRRVPGWWSGHAFANSADTSLQLRQRVWEALKGRNLHVTWYDGLRLDLRIGTDISRLLFVGGEIDPNEFSFLADTVKPGMCVLDVGANEGLYSLFLRNCVGASGRVIAFEPSRREADRLRRNLAFNRFDDVAIHEVALGDREGLAMLHIAEDGHAGHNAVGDFAAPWVRAAEKRDVPLTTLDILSREWPKVDLIKLDIEGMEFAALRGAERLLARDRPILLFEAEPESLALRGEKMDAFLDWLRQHDYRLMDFSADGAPADLGTRQPATVNLVAISN